MADQTLRANRRSILGGGALAVAAVAAVSIPTISMAAAAPSRAAWNAALANVARAKAAFEATQPAFKQAEALYLSLKPKRLTADEIIMPILESGAGLYGIEGLEGRVATLDEDYKRRDDLAKHQSGFKNAHETRYLAMCAEWDATETLIQCPAPDIAAVALKIKAAEGHELQVADLGPVLADLRRLGSVA